MPADQARQLITDLSHQPAVGSVDQDYDNLERWFALDECAYAAQIGVDRWHAIQLKEMDSLSGGSPTEHAPGLNWILAASIVPVHFNHCLREINAVFDRLTVAAKLTDFRDRLKAVREITHAYALPDISASDLLYRPTNVLLPGSLQSVDRIIILAQRNQAQRDMALITLALAVYHESHHAYPATLDDLKIENILASFPLDGFTGKAYVYHLAADGYVLYTPGDENKSEGDRSLERWGVVRVSR